MRCSLRSSRRDRWKARRHEQLGLTLVEVMVSLTVLSIAIAAAFSMAFTLSNGYQSHKRGLRIENTARVVLDLMASAVRSASPGIAGGQIWDVCTGTNLTTIEHVNSSTGPDELRVLHAAGGAFTLINSPQDLSSGVLNVEDSSTFEADLWTPAIIVDPSTGNGHLMEVFADSSATAQLIIRPPGGCAIVSAGTTSYSAGSVVVRALHAHYYLDPPFLMVDPDGPGPEEGQVMAEGLEDLQIAVAVENGADTTTITETALQTDDEWHHNNAGDTAPEALTLGNWRALRITVVAVDIRETQESTAFVRPGAEDRAAGSTGDSFRRRAFTTTVKLRNFADD